MNDFVAHPPVGSDAQLAMLKTVVRTAEPAERRLAARNLAVRWPDSVVAQAVMAIESRDAERLEALRRARKLTPNDPAIGWAIASATRDSGSLDEAVDGLSTYLAADDSPGVSRLRARLQVARSIQQGYERAERNGITIFWPAANLTNAQANEIAAAVDRDLDAAAALTGTERRTALTVIVYPSPSEMLAVSCAQAWTAALFDGTLRLIAAPTPEGVRMTSVRHETLHAQLTPHAPNAPRWFHEGVAQSFRNRSIPDAWQLMVRNKTWVPSVHADSVDEWRRLVEAGKAGVFTMELSRVAELIASASP